MIAFITESAGPVRGLEAPVRPSAPCCEGEFLTMPTDLRLWADPPTILGWIEQEAGSLAQGQGRTWSSSPGLLRLLAFAYATRVFSSEDIASQCRTNELFRRLCPGGAPFIEEVRAFRRKNRLPLQTLLSGVFLRAVLHRFGLSAPSIPAELRSDLNDHARERLNIARHLDAADE